MRNFLRKLVVLAVVLLSASVVSAKNQSITSLCNSNSFLVRYGIGITEGIEAGPVIECLDLDGLPASAGIFASYTLPGDVNIPNPLPFAGLPKEVTGKIYGGLELGVDVSTDMGTFYKPFAGVIFWKLFNIEWSYVGAGYKLGEVNSEQQISLGLRFTF